MNRDLPANPAAAPERYRRGVELLEADVNEELVALDPQLGICYGFNGVATDVWRRLDQPKTFDELRDELLSDYEVSAEECTEDLKALLTDLQKRGLVAVDRTQTVA